MMTFVPLPWLGNASLAGDTDSRIVKSRYCASYFTGLKMKMTPSSLSTRTRTTKTTRRHGWRIVNISHIVFILLSRQRNHFSCGVASAMVTVSNVKKKNAIGMMDSHLAINDQATRISSPQTVAFFEETSTLQLPSAPLSKMLETKVEKNKNKEDENIHHSLCEKLQVPSFDDIDLSSSLSSLLHRDHHHPLVLGHRGALYESIENTLPSFQACADLGCDGMELDVFCLSDNSLVVFHGGGTDENPGQLQDYFGCPGTIFDYPSYDKLREMRLEYQPTDVLPTVPTSQTMRPTTQDVAIPTLEEVLNFAKDRGLIVKIELKGEGTVGPTLALVEKLDMVSQCQFSSFNTKRLELLRKLRPEQERYGEHKYKTGWILSSLPADNDGDDVMLIRRAEDLGVNEIHLKYDLCTKRRIRNIRQAGLKTMAWMRGPAGMIEDVDLKYWDVGNEDVRMYSALLCTGVDQLCVNRPEVLLQIMQSAA